MFECYEDFENFVSQRLAILREQKKISARDMSLSLGMSDGYINHIENKISMPSMQGFYYICEYLKIEPKEFFDDGVKVPALTFELMKEIQNMDEKSLQGLLSFIKSMKK